MASLQLNTKLSHINLNIDRRNIPKGNFTNLKFNFGSVNTNCLVSCKRMVQVASFTDNVTPSYRLTPSEVVLETWKNADAVCFDVDSTVCEDEGIDELAEFCGAGEIVSQWTRKAMGGSVPFEVALSERLNLFKPTTDDVSRFLKDHPPRLSPGIKDLVQKLALKGKDVYLVSGGFRQMIEPVADILGIPKTRIFANLLLFEESGQFSGFDTNEPTSKSGGKAVAIKLLKEKFGYKTLVMIGDGATDLEARTAGGADIFIGYGGVQVRSKVAEGADWFVYKLEDLTNALE